jgi:hypothetical protein
MSLSSYETAQLCKRFTGRVTFRSNVLIKEVTFREAFTLAQVLLCIMLRMMIVFGKTTFRASDRQDAVDQMRERYPLAQIKQ